MFRHVERGDRGFVECVKWSTEKERRNRSRFLGGSRRTQATTTTTTIESRKEPEKPKEEGSGIKGKRQKQAQSREGHWVRCDARFPLFLGHPSSYSQFSLAVDLLFRREHMALRVHTGCLAGTHAGHAHTRPTTVIVRVLDRLRWAACSRESTHTFGIICK